MNEKELLEKIDGEKAAEIFAELYGTQAIADTRLRYKTLIEKMLSDNDFPQNELAGKENFRVFSTPGRTELGGNHTDHNRGKVLAASIQMDSVAIVKERDDGIVFFRSTGYPDVKVKLIDSNGKPDLNPKPEEREKTEALVRGIAAGINRKSNNRDGLPIKGFSANADSNVLPGSGLSSSAAVEVNLCRIFDSLKKAGEPLTPLEMAQIGQFAENAYFGKPCGLMDQTACASGGVVAIDFKNAASPEVKQINFNLSALGYALCVVNTGGNHADLTADYASIPKEMKAVAEFFGKSVLRDLDKETVLNSAAEVRKKYGDRAFLRSLHFFNENTRVEAMTDALIKMDSSDSASAKQSSLETYLNLVNESGESSWEILQNIYSPARPETQAISVALALTRDYFNKQKLKGAYRVHGGGFAGTIQVYIPIDAIDSYRAFMEQVFGSGSLTILRIRPKGAIELRF